MSPFEQRILALERRYYPLPRQEITKLLQDIWQLDPQAYGGSCVITVRVVVSDGSSYISGATVTILQSGVAVGSAMTDSSGLAVIYLSSAGTYTYSVSATGYSTVTGTVGALTCGNTYTVNVLLCTISFLGSVSAITWAGVVGGFSDCYTVTPSGIAYTVTDASTGTVYFTGTTGTSGHLSGTLSGVSGPVSALFNFTSGGNTASVAKSLACGSNTVTLSPPPVCGSTVIPSTLHWTDTYFGGSGTLAQGSAGLDCEWRGTYTPSSGPYAGDTWNIFLVYTFPGQFGMIWESTNNPTHAGSSVTTGSFTCSPLNMVFTLPFVHNGLGGQDFPGTTMTVTP